MSYFKKTEKDLIELYKGNYSGAELKKIHEDFGNTYGIDTKNIDLNRFILFSDEEIAEIDKLAQGRFNNNRKAKVNQVGTGCGEAASYLERDFPGLIGEKAFEKYLSKYNKKTSTDINSIELSSKDNGTDSGDFIVDNIKLEVKTNMFDKEHRKQNSLNLQSYQLDNLREVRDNLLFVQVIIVSPKIAYISGYTSWFEARDFSIFPSDGRSKYHAVPFRRIKYTSFNNISKLLELFKIEAEL